MSNVTYHGNVEVREAPESGEREITDVERLRLVYRGKYADLAAAQPAAGDDAAVEGHAVEGSRLRRLRGDMGELSVDVVAKAAPGIHVPGGALTSVVETDMAMVDRPLLAKKEWAAYAPEIECWRSEAVAAIRAGLKYTDKDGELKDLQGEAKKIAALMLRGVESWLDFAPVITRTSTYGSRPDPENIGRIGSPPVSVPGSWEYLKTCDKARQTGKGTWERVEQWTGAEKWERDLYQES